MGLMIKIRCGKTRSNKVIYDLPIGSMPHTPHPRHSDFAPQDHFDAFAVFSFLSARSASKSGKDDSWTQHFARQADLHRSILEEIGLFAAMWKEVNLVTVFDLQTFAQKMVYPPHRG